MRKRGYSELVVEATLRPRCSLCWQGHPTPKVVDHSPADCVLLKKFNKTRTSNKLPPITLGRNSIEVSNEKVPISTDELAKRLAQVEADFKEKLLKMEQQLKSMEWALKCKAEDLVPTQPHPPKRQKRPGLTVANVAVNPPCKKQKGKKHALNSRPKDSP